MDFEVKRIRKEFARWRTEKIPIFSHYIMYIFHIVVEDKKLERSISTMWFQNYNEIFRIREFWNVMKEFARWRNKMNRYFPIIRIFPISLSKIKNRKKCIYYIISELTRNWLGRNLHMIESRKKYIYVIPGLITSSWILGMLGRNLHNEEPKRYQYFPLYVCIIVHRRSKIGRSVFKSSSWFPLSVISRLIMNSHGFWGAKKEFVYDGK